MNNYVKSLDTACGKNDPLTVTRGKLHEHLGMTLDFRTKGRAIFAQHGAMKKFWMIPPEELRGSRMLTPSPENLFKVGTTSPKLDTKRVEEHHAVTAKVLHFGQRTRADLQVSSGHHCARVKNSSEQD